MNEAEMTYKPEVSYWLNQIETASMEEKEWRETDAPDVIEKFKAKKQFNVLNSNTELLNSVLFNNLPKPVVNRRFPKKMTLNKADNELFKYGTEVLQSALNYEMDSQFNKKKKNIKNAIQDYSLVGRGINWINYGADIETEGDNEVITNQTITLKYINWQDFRQSPSRTEDDVWWIGKREWLRKQDVEKLFGKEKADNADLDYMVTDSGYSEIKDVDKKTIPDGQKRAEVWEVWDSKSKKRYVFSSSSEEFLRVDDDPYLLENFFPIAEPLRYVKTTDTTIPYPEYKVYEKTAEDLENVCGRISELTKEMKYRGIYPSKWGDTLKQLAKSSDGTFLPVDMPIDLAMKGGLHSIFMAEPNKEKSEVVMNLYQNKSSLISDIYQITGIADIMRGGSDPRESASSVKLKSKFGSMRIKTRQEDIQTHIQSLTELIAEIICEHYEIDRLKQITSIELPMQADKEEAKFQYATLMQQAQQLKKQPPAKPLILDMPSWEEIVKFLGNEKLRSYAIDIETEYTAFDNEEEEKRSTNEFIIAMTSMMQQSMQFIQAMPESAMLVKQLFMMGMKSYSIGRRVEDTVDMTFDKLMKKLSQPKQPQPNTELIKAQAAKTVADARLLEVQGTLKNEQNKLASQNQNNQLKLQSIVSDNSLSHREKAMDLAISDKIANIKQQAQDLDVNEFQLKIKELFVQMDLKNKELEMKGNTNTNIPGEVQSFD